ncbi:endolytic transglycosylase MltG [Candidatus Daviesbacteria bacterium]|nr:endolytic transglycosylase MltG [Candidatus Daviesbacteria bacterium]
MKKDFFRNWIILLFLVFIAFLAAKFYWSYLNSPVNPTGEVIAFVIPRGESTDSIGKRLEKMGLIRSNLVFKTKLRLTKMVGKIEAGDFKLSGKMSLDEIIKTLSSGSVDKWVTIVEGLRVEEVAKKLADELGIGSDEFIQVAEEGYMFPDTYLFNPKTTPENIASIMKNNFEQKYDQELQGKIKKQGLTLEEGVILASLVEREARSDKARTEIAGILLRRFNEGVGLNVDASIQYALGFQEKEKSWWKRHLSNDDKLIESPYNTYKYRGLPPTPICNPSLSSLKAVANANPNTPYLFYYHDSAGNSHYAKTLDEHHKNISTYP